MRPTETRDLQRSLNFFSGKFLKGLAPLIVDGEFGAATKHRVRIVKWNLGFNRPLTVEPTLAFRRRLRHPKSLRWANAATVARGVARRRTQRKKFAQNLQQAARQSGVTTFDGKPVAKWLVPYMQWARDKGLWHGQLNSGWRDPAYSEHLCFQICGAPSCSGRCAGRSSHHSQSSPPNGAIDVSDYVAFGNAMRQCPIQPRIFNALPIDPVHFSAQGN